MATVLIDLDGTLTRKDSFLPFLFYCVKTFGLRVGPTLALPLFLLLYWIGMVTNARLKEAFLQSVLSGVPVAELGPVVERYVEYLVEKGLNRELAQTLQEHLKKGDRVVLATASFDLYTVKLAEKLGILSVVCTQAEVRDGIVTGRIAGENCHGPEKVRRLEAVLTSSEWRTSILYTDHYSDLPLLKKVSQGFLVNPGARTRDLLKAYGFTLFSHE